MGFENVGKVWDLPGFKQFIRGQDLSWAKGITLHHTAAPTLQQRPEGFRVQHIRNIASYYRDQLGWSSGPHLFVDEDQVFGMSTLERRGVHARSFNATHIGIEVLGNYDHERPEEGRGLNCWRMAAQAVGAILDRTGLTPESVNFHRDDPRTSKTCPGKLVSRAMVLGLIPTRGDREDDPATGEGIEKRLAAIEWQIGQIRRELS